MSGTLIVAITGLLLSTSSLTWQAVTAFVHRRRTVISVRPIYEPGSVLDARLPDCVYLQVTVRALRGPSGHEDIDVDWPGVQRGWAFRVAPEIASSDGTWPPGDRNFGTTRLLQDGQVASWVFRITTSGPVLEADARVRAVVVLADGRRIRSELLTIERDRPATSQRQNRGRVPVKPVQSLRQRRRLDRARQVQAERPRGCERRAAGRSTAR